MKREVAWVAAAFGEWAETVEWFEASAPEVLSTFSAATRSAVRELSRGSHGVVIGFFHEKRRTPNWSKRVPRR